MPRVIRGYMMYSYIKSTVTYETHLALAADMGKSHLCSNGEVTVYEKIQ
jgi:hypothetical protein